MSEPDRPAFPQPTLPGVKGLTKREYMATHLLAGLLAAESREWTYQDAGKAAKHAVDHADALLAELAK